MIYNNFMINLHKITKRVQVINKIIFNIHKLVINKVCKKNKI